MTAINITRLSSRLAFYIAELAKESRHHKGPIREELIRAGLQLGAARRTLHTDPKAAAAIATAAPALIARAAVTRAFTKEKP